MRFFTQEWVDYNSENPKKAKARNAYFQHIESFRAPLPEAAVAYEEYRWHDSRIIGVERTDDQLSILFDEKNAAPGQIRRLTFVGCELLRLDTQFGDAYWLCDELDTLPDGRYWIAVLASGCKYYKYAELELYARDIIMEPVPFTQAQQRAYEAMMEKLITEGIQATVGMPSWRDQKDD